MATMAAAARDFNQASDMSRDNLAVVAARSVPATTVTRSQALPTPPNSISPALPPHGLKAQLQKAKLEPIDSDLDLHDEQARRQASRSPSHDTTGTISTSLLAKHHLPEILLNHGPLAIRHIMGYLTTSVPGFAGIPPTKARRLVVDYRSGIPISKNGGRGTDRSRLNAASSSNGDESFVFSHDDRDAMMMECEADKMSLDGSASASCSEAPDDDDTMNDDPEDATDDEDWAAVGAAALRAESYNAAAHSAGRSFLSNGVYTSGGLRAVATGMARSHQPLPFDFSALGATSDAQEREAVEALLRLGSV
uniref:Uncharacterized protein n=1 Tax=Colletotrichum fructicola (strain Nara gc5) TaxID=1213859 RepID=L2GCY2_COLFN